MFAPSYFPSAYWPAAYFGGATGAAVAGEPGTRPLAAAFAARDFTVTFLDDPTMPRHVTWTKGETREPIRFTLRHTIETPDGPALVRLPLGAATVTAQLKGVTTGTELLTAACTVVNPAATGPTDPDAGDAELALAALQALPADDYQVRFTADFGGGVRQIWPTQGHCLLTIRDLFTVAG